MTGSCGWWLWWWCLSSVSSTLMCSISPFFSTLDLWANCDFVVEQKTASKRNGGYSLPLVCKIVEALKSRQEKFYVQTFCVLRHNTRRDFDENFLPIITGVVVFVYLFFPLHHKLFITVIWQESIVSCLTLKSE